jgi:penicillin-binding protein 2
VHCPQLDRAVQAAYPPGSTFKAIMATAALESGIASPGGRYACPGSITIGGTVFHNWEAGQGSLSLPGALAKSCDTVFFGFADDWWHQEGGITLDPGKKEVMQYWAARFGLGQPTGIDLPDETQGLIPGRAYKQQVWEQNKKQYCDEYYRTHERLFQDLCIRGYIWNPGDALNMSIGQGDVAVTPLQLARAYAAIANGGTVYTPHIGWKVLSSGKVVQSIAPSGHALGASAPVLAYVRRALQTVPVSGTAQFPFRGWPFAKYPIAAKTGSAEIQGKQPYSWFAAFGPVAPDGHQYVAVAVVEQAGHGAEVAGPIVRRVMDHLYHLPLTPIVYGGRSD